MARRNPDGSGRGSSVAGRGQPSGPPLMTQASRLFASKNRSAVLADLREHQEMSGDGEVFESLCAGRESDSL